MDPAKHRVIAMALERGLLKRLHIDGDKMKPIEVDEENLLKDSEEFYVNSKPSFNLLLEKMFFRCRHEATSYVLLM